jgi:fructokinase
MSHSIGLDLGGTKIEGVVLDAGGAIVRRERVPTGADRGYAAIVETAAGLAETLMSDLPEVASIGVGTPGAVSRRTGKLRNSNTQCLNGRDLPGDLAKRLGRPLVVENDANCFALAEATLGAGRGHRVVFAVIMGTGVGGGIAIDGRIYAGPQHIAGEWGHHSIDPAGPSCYCGQRGCVETYLSGPALAAAYRAAGGRGGGGAGEIVAAARAGDDAAQRVVADFLDRFGRAVANLIDILDPDAVVLGGGLSNIDELYDAGRAAVESYVFNDELTTPILRNRLGDSAGVIGAALLDASRTGQPR